MQPNSPCVCLERQRCALWIRKLCEPSGIGAGIPGRRNRNLYAKLLLHMLRRGLLEGPFTQRPEPGTLRALPSYMVGVHAKRLTAHARAGALEGPACLHGRCARQAPYCTCPGGGARGPRLPTW